MSSITKLLKYVGIGFVGLIVFAVVIGALFGEETDNTSQTTFSEEREIEEMGTVVEAQEGLETEQEATQSQSEDVPEFDSNEDAHSNSNTYDVVRVTDGDTISVYFNGEITSVRLIGIDTPETVHPSKPVQCFGKEASDKAKELLSNKAVTLEFDASQGQQDKYGRLLSYVFLSDGTNFNKLMIEQGYAYEYTYSTAYKYQDPFKLAQQEAENNQRGLWASEACESYQEAEPEPEPTPEPQTQGSYICSYNAYNCGDFSTHSEAQSTYEACGGVNNDIHKLDRDKDGLSCESLP